MSNAALTSKAQLGILTRPDGSAQYSEGATTVIAGIYGPVETKINKALMEKASVEAIFRPKIGFPGVKDRVIESIVRNVCEATLALTLYPRASVILVIQELQNSGQLISCALNAACLAALDSGIDMKCMWGAVTCFLDDENQLKLLAPVNEEEIKARFVFVFDNVEKNIITSHIEGSFTVEQYKDALDLCRAESSKVFNFFKRSVVIN